MSGAFSGRPHSAFAAMARSRCTECRRPVQWGSAADLRWIVPAEDRSRVEHLIGVAGGDADAWHCPACGAWGVFGSDWVA